MCSKASVWAIIVLYNPKLEELIPNLRAILSQVDKVVLLDNSENKILKHPILEYYFSKIIYKKLPYNKGLGAVNVGLKLAYKYNVDYVILFDQDSKPESDLINKLMEGLRMCRDNLDKPIAAIGPTLINKHTGRPFQEKRIFEFGRHFIGGCLEIVDQLPTSGLLIPISAIKEVGYFCEKLFLDITDFEWCWRAKKKGFYILRHTRAFMEHALGVGTKRIFWIEYNVPAPYRQYHLFKNSIFAILCDYAPVYMRLRYLFLTIIKALLFPIVLDNKISRLKYIIKGLKDGIKYWIFSSNKCIQE